MRKVEVHKYNENWVALYDEEAEKIKSIFGDNLADIFHIGSTSVPGLKAKPTIDIMPVVHDIEAVDDYNDEMRRIGYEPRGEFGISGRRYFPKGGDNRTHHVHVFEQGSNDVTRHLAFRDYLRHHDDVRDAYGDLKARLAEQFPDDMDAYINGKEQLVLDIEKKALEWFRIIND